MGEFDIDQEIEDFFVPENLGWLDLAMYEEVKNYNLEKWLNELVIRNSSLHYREYPSHSDVQ